MGGGIGTSLIHSNFQHSRKGERNSSSLPPQLKSRLHVYFLFVYFHWNWIWYIKNVFYGVQEFRNNQPSLTLPYWLHEQTGKCHWDIICLITGMQASLELWDCPVSVIGTDSYGNLCNRPIWKKTPKNRCYCDINIYC